MQRLAAFVFAMSLLFPVAACGGEDDSVYGTPALLDAKYGFRGLKFGTPRSAVDGLDPAPMKPDPKDPELEFERFIDLAAYKGTNNLTIFGLPLSSLTFVFSREHLHKVVFSAQCNSVADLKKVTHPLWVMFGPSKKTENLDGQETISVWESKKVRLSVREYTWKNRAPSLTGEIVAKDIIESLERAFRAEKARKVLSEKDGL